MLGTILLFLFIIFFLVLAHEWGHYFFARRAGIVVEEFGIGFPPRLLSWRPKKGETLFTLNLIPLGGFVLLKGEDATDPRARVEPGSLVAAPRTAQALVLVGGVLMNIVVGWALYSLAYAQGILVDAETAPPEAEVLSRTLVLGDVLPESPAARAGIQPGDILLRIRGMTTGKVVEHPGREDLVAFVQENDELELTLLRGGETRVVRVAPADKLGSQEQRAIGVVPIEALMVRVPWRRAPWEGAKHTLASLNAIAQGFVALIAQALRGGDALSSLTGPVGIAALVGEASAMGWRYLVPFVAFISLNLAVINLLPFPALDGGRLFLLGIEALLRRPIPPKVVRGINAAGFALLIMLAVLITYRDISRFWAGGS